MFIAWICLLQIGILHPQIPDLRQSRQRLPHLLSSAYEPAESIPRSGHHLPVVQSSVEPIRPSIEHHVDPAGDQAAQDVPTPSRPMPVVLLRRMDGRPHRLRNYATGVHFPKGVRTA